MIVRPANRLVLLVEDEQPLRNSGRRVLESLGYRVVVAEDGRAGVDRFRETHADLGLVLLDMTMPNMSGRAAFEAMLAIDSRVPIILCSGYTDDVTVRAMLAQGLAGYLAKPYRKLQLAELLEQVAAAWMIE